MRSYSVFVSVFVTLMACRDATVPAPGGVAQRAAISAGTCMQDVWNQHGNTQTLGCSANDVSVAFATNIRDVNGNPLGQCQSGSTFSFIADFNVQLTATARFDLGLYFATGGQATALTGTCSANIVRPVDPLTGLGSPNFVQLDPAPDQCGDINSANNPQIVTVRVDNVLCRDDNGNGTLDLPNCTSWRQPGSNTVCQTANDAFPGSPSKCHCDAGFEVPIQVENGALVATKVAQPVSLPEPGGEFTFQISTTNTAQFTNVTVDRICDDRYGTVAGTGCPAGTLATVNSTTCTVPQVLAPGQTYACEFKGNLIASSATTDTDTVTFSGHDDNAGPVSAQASAQVAVTDVPPTALVVKSFVQLLCSDVRYQVRVQNTSGSDVLHLTSLTDSSFGDVTTVHGAVLATTCQVPQDIAIGGEYACTFDAHFCGGSDTDVATATVNDGEGNVISPASNPVTVTVNASAP